MISRLNCGQEATLKMKRYEHVFDVLENDPANAENLKIRAQLTHALTIYIKREQRPQKDAAVVFGVNQPRTNYLVRGKIARFTIDMRVNMLARTGKRMAVKIAKSAAWHLMPHHGRDVRPIAQGSWCFHEKSSATAEPPHLGAGCAHHCVR